MDEGGTHDGLQLLGLHYFLFEEAEREAVEDIAVIAQRIGNRVHITVSDTGPGSAVGTNDGGPRPSSTGVGLANIRDRLAKAYGNDHRFETTAGPEGFAVTIDIPYQAR